MPEEKDRKEMVNPNRRKDSERESKPGKKATKEEDVKGYQDRGVDPREPGGIAE